MTQRLLIIGGGIQGMMSASAAAQSGARSELIVTEHALGPMGASLNSAGENLPHGRRNRTRSLTRKCPVALAAMAASAVSGGFRPVAMRVVAGPGEVSDRDQLREPLGPAWPGMASLAPNFLRIIPVLEHRWTRCRRRALPDRPTRTGTCRKHSRGLRLASRQAARKVALSGSRTINSMLGRDSYADVPDRQIFTSPDNRTIEEGQHSLEIQPERNALSVAAHMPWSIVSVGHTLASARLPLTGMFDQPLFSNRGPFAC